MLRKGKKTHVFFARPAAVQKGLGKEALLQDYLQGRTAESSTNVGGGLL